MDRDKKQPKRSAAAKVKPPPVSDFIALGSKPFGGSSEPAKTRSTAVTKARKSATSRRVGVAPARRESAKEWDAVAVEVDSADLVHKVLEAEETGDDERAEALICGAVKKLRFGGRTKFDAALCLGLQYLAKSRPFLFCSELAAEAFCGLLRRDVAANFSKSKSGNWAAVLAANVLMAAHRDESSWPEIFVKAYVEDSLAERTWVDHDFCRGFVDNILTAFNTKSAIHPTGGADDDESCSSMSAEMQENLDSVPVFPRYVYSEDSLTQHVLDVFKEQLTRRQPTEVSRNLLKFLVSTCGISDIRLGVAPKLELWLQNPKLAKPAQELLLAVCLNCNKHNQQDVEVISQLKIRIKAKPVINHYLQCMKEMVGQHPENLSSLLKHTIYNELSNSRNLNNMQLLGILFQHYPDKAATVLADVFLELLCNKEDYLRALRVLLREIVRSVRHELNFPLFCVGLVQEKKDAAFTELELPLKERMFLSITDLIVLAIFLGVSPSVKEQYAQCSRGERKEISALRSYQFQVSNIQKDCVSWMHTSVLKVYRPNRNEFMHCIHKVLFMEQMEHYYNKDNWPSEGDRFLLLRIASEVPLLEETLTQILVGGLSRDHSLTAHDALELALELVKRTASTHLDHAPVLEFDSTDLCDIVFNLCAYHHPENISLPQGYHPPELAISELYWKGWFMLLVIVCHNPGNFGEMAWKTCPMLRNLMEMCITNQFVFPPPTVGEKAEEVRNREQQMSQIEKDEILLFEGHLAAASTKVTITEANSLLISKLISMDPHGPARKPPGAVLEQMKAMNAKLRLGDLLCRSRNPDFLLDVIQRQGTTQSMSWLSELVESSASSFNMLPVQCLCEFLISDGGASSEYVEDAERYTVKKKQKQEQLLLHLRNLLREPDSEPRDTIEVIGYFAKRLSSRQSSARSSALKGLAALLSSPDDPSDCWLLERIPALPHFEVVRCQISLFLRQACQIENDPAMIAAYVAFLATHTPECDLPEFADLSLDVAQMIVERPTIVNTILAIETIPSSDFLASVSEIFFKYLTAAQIPTKEVYSWSESQDQILIQWSSGESATMHILVVHAMIIVLTYGAPLHESASYFDALLNIWFPSDSDQPKAFLVDTSEEALLLPDWLKLRMIRSSVGVLVDAALRDLDACQLVLFIQSFGIPVSSMSKLLRTLDCAVEADSYSVEQAVVDKSYMSQLVEVQRRRGATGGEKFAKLLLDADSPDIPMDVESSLNQTSVIQRVPPKLPVAMINPASMSVSLGQLLGLFTPSSGVLSAKQEQDIFKGLQKALSKDILEKTSDNGAISFFILACERFVKSETKTAFLQALHKKSYFSSVLLRLATASQMRSDIAKSPLAQKLKWICQQIIYALSTRNSSLLTVALQFYNKHKPPETMKPAPWKTFVQRYNPESCDNIKKIVEIAETDDSLRLEEVMQFLVKNAISRGDTQYLMDAMTDVTVKRLASSVAPSLRRSKFCFFVDWLECLEPKIVGSFPESRCHLLFSSIASATQTVDVPFRPYLLALLIHQSGWQILHYYIHAVLGQSESEFQYDPTSVLDFLHACIHIPKIWQGRYTKSKKSSEEDILALSEQQIVAVVDCILREALRRCAEEEEDSLAGCVEGRMKLLMKCLASRATLTEACVRHLLSVMSGGGTQSKHAQELLLQLYHRTPSVLSLIPDTTSFLSDASTCAGQQCSGLDVVSHTLLLSLARTDSSKQCLTKMMRIEFVCKKMARAHPVLLLRQMPMMITLLRGRVHLDYHLFRQQNHAALFSCFLGVLELLPPFAFASEHGADLDGILSLYVEMFRTYGIPKELIHLSNRFFAFLALFAEARPLRAQRFVRPHVDLLQELAMLQPDASATLRAVLVTCGRGAHRGCSADDSSTAPPSLACGRPEEVAQALQELEGASFRKPALLEGVAEDLKSLMHESNAQLRTPAFSLAMRFVKSDPVRGEAFVSAFLRCLESEHADVVLTALEHLPEFTVLVQEHALVLLRKAFGVGITRNINTAMPIKATLSYLVMQNGC